MNKKRRGSWNNATSAETNSRVVPYKRSVDPGPRYSLGKEKEKNQPRDTFDIDFEFFFFLKKEPSLFSSSNVLAIFFVTVPMFWPPLCRRPGPVEQQTILVFSSNPEGRERKQKTPPPFRKIHYATQIGHREGVIFSFLPFNDFRT